MLKHKLPLYPVPFYSDLVFYNIPAMIQCTHVKFRLKMSFAHIMQSLQIINVTQCRIVICEVNVCTNTVHFFIIFNVKLVCSEKSYSCIILTLVCSPQYPSIYTSRFLQPATYVSYYTAPLWLLQVGVPLRELL